MVANTTSTLSPNARTSLHTALPPSESESVNASRTPRDARYSAVALPMPDAAPVHQVVSYAQRVRWECSPVTMMALPLSGCGGGGATLVYSSSCALLDSVAMMRMWGKEACRGLQQPAAAVLISPGELHLESPSTRRRNPRPATAPRQPHLAAQGTGHSSSSTDDCDRREGRRRIITQLLTIHVSAQLCLQGLGWDGVGAVGG